MEARNPDPKDPTRPAGVYGAILNLRPQPVFPANDTGGDAPNVKSQCSFFASVLRMIDRCDGKKRALRAGIQRCEFELPDRRFII